MADKKEWKDMSKSEKTIGVVLAVVILLVVVGVINNLSKTSTSLNDSLENSNETVAQESQKPEVAEQAPFEPITISGSGIKPTDMFELPNGAYKITAIYQGEMNFISDLMNSSGEIVENISNEIGSTELTRVVTVSSGKYFFEVEHGSGNWSFKIESL